MLPCRSPGRCPGSGERVGAQTQPRGCRVCRGGAHPASRPPAQALAARALGPRPRRREPCAAALSWGSRHTRGGRRASLASVRHKQPLQPRTEPGRRRLGAQTLPPLRPWASSHSRTHRTAGSGQQGALPISVVRPKLRVPAPPSPASALVPLGLSLHPHTPWRRGVPCCPPHRPSGCTEQGPRPAGSSRNTDHSQPGRWEARLPNTGQERGAEPVK